MSPEAAERDFLNELASRPAARQPASFSEIMSAEWASSGLDTLTGSLAPMEEAYEDLLGKAEAATGKSLRMHISVPVEERIDIIRFMTGDLDAEKRKELEPLFDVRLNAAKKAQAIERQADETRAATYGLSGHALAFLTGMARQVVDPVNLATIPAGGPLKGPVLKMLGREFLLNAGIQAAQEPVIQTARGELGLEAGFGEAAGNVLEAGIGGAGLAGFFRAAGAGLRHLRGRRAAAESADASIAPDATVSPDRTEFRMPESPEAAAPRSVVDDLAPEDFEAAARAIERDQVVDEQIPPFFGAEGRALEERAIEAAADVMERGTIEAWHGSPWDFEQFSLAHVDTGEGAQAFGFGLYFAQARPVAEAYRKALAMNRMGPVDDAAERFFQPGTIVPSWAGRDRVLSFERSKDGVGFTVKVQEVDRAGNPVGRPRTHSTPPTPEQFQAVVGEQPGFLYRVQITADQDRFLDWDKPLNEQSPYVKDALQRYLELRGGYYEGGIANARQRAGDFFKARGEENARTSQFLNEAGIPGIKYLDSGSRGDRAGTRNFVVFDDKLIQIVEKNDAPVAPRPEVPPLQDLPLPTIKDTGSISPVPLNAPKPKRGPAARDPQTWSLFEFLASRGGLKPDPELDAILDGRRFVPGFGPLIRKTGMSLDRAREAAVEAGYFRDAGADRGGVTTSTVNELLRALDDESRGLRRYVEGQERSEKFDAAENRAAIEREFEGQMADAEIDTATIDRPLLDRAVQIMEKEGERDALVAFERAVMEDGDRYERAFKKRKADADLADIPGWDVPDDAGAAPPQRGASARNRSGDDAGGETAGGEAGEPSRGAGARDREADAGGGGEHQQLGDPALARDAARVLDESGDLSITMKMPDGTFRNVSAREILQEAEEEAAAARELADCIGMAPESVP